MPPSYSFNSGLLGCFMYAFSSALPVLLIAYYGDKIREQFPKVLSLSDYAKLRFGLITQVAVVIISLFNMSLFAVAELSTISSIFSEFVGLGSYDFFVVLLISVTTLTYTAFGGLKTSIETDNIQATCSAVLFVVLTVYVVATFRVSKPLWNDTAKGTTKSGFSSILTMPLSMVTSTVFSEVIWQRVWASETRGSLFLGAAAAALLVAFVVLVSGVFGILVLVARRTSLGKNNDNILIFSAVNSEYYLNLGEKQPIVRSAIGALVVIMGVIMNESAIDSIQNALVASISGSMASYSSKLQDLKLTRRHFRWLWDFATVSPSLMDLTILFQWPLWLSVSFAVPCTGSSLVGRAR
ncbi:uncharacterized protein LOC135122011 [Zophobas morio]|uniref:uncharacterized protein LOC135122011 n=1 Tax=Zophobas morio TaxID=2755281 RepID=UPI00308396F7